MRILKVHNYYFQPGGEDTVFQSECELLRSNGHEVIEYTESNEKIKQRNKAQVALQTLWSQDSYQLFSALLKKNKPEVVHFHNIFPLLSPSVYYACQVVGIPVVQTLDNQRLMCPAASFYRNGELCLDCLGMTLPLPSIIHACYHNSRLHTAVVASMLTLHKLLGTWQKRVAAFLCSTAFYQDLFIQSGLPPEKLFLVPHFVMQTAPINSFHPSGNYVLFVGRLDPEKGIKTLLEGWQHTNIPLKIRGDGQLKEYAEAFIHQNKLSHIEFIGRLSRNELSKLISNARFVVVPSEGYYETFGMVIVEAYSMKVPVLASNIGVATELVLDQKTGIKFEVGNPLDLNVKAKWMWEHPAELSVMGKMAFSIYQERFTPEKCYQALLGVYERVTALK